MVSALLDGENEEAMVWADSAYQGRLLESLLEEAGYGSRIQEKGSGQASLSEAAKERGLTYNSAKLPSIKH